VRKGLLSGNPHVREHPFIRDAEAARLCTERLIRLSKETGRPVHILHVSTKDELVLLSEAKQEGLKVTCEVTPQHLTFTAADYESLGSLVQMNPPVRDLEHGLALWEALDEGLFDVFGSDHAPHTLEEKSQPYPKSPSGMPGVQTMLPALLEYVAQGRLALEKVVHMTAERPASLYGIADKGRVEPGYDADLAIVDLTSTVTVTKEWLKSKCGWSPFEGRTLRGRPVHTIVGGAIAMKAGSPVDRAGKRVGFTWKA
jgi:dihydroorotase